MKKQVNLNTALIPSMFSGMYESIWSNWIGDFEADLDSEEHREEAEKAQDKAVNWEVFIKYVGECILESYNNHNDLNEIIDFVEEIDPKSIYQPSEYNFRTDSFAFDVNIDLPKATEYLLGYIDVTLEYVKDNWHSRSGFISFMPDSDGVADMLNYPDFDDEKEAQYISVLFIIVSEIAEGNFGYNEKWWNAELCAYDNFIGKNSNYDFLID